MAKKQKTKSFPHVYELHCDGVPFYVGKSVWANRAPQHLTPGGAANAYRVKEFVKAARALNKTLSYIIIPTETEEMAFDLEEELIKKYGFCAHGGLLVNVRIGSRGANERSGKPAEWYAHFHKNNPTE